MTQISRRNINKGLAWSVPAAVVAGTAPAFASSSTDVDPPVVVEPTPVALLLEAENPAFTKTGRAQTHTVATLGETLQEPNGANYEVRDASNASGGGAVNWIGGGNGTVTFTFSIPAGATDFALEVIYFSHPNSPRIDYVVNGTTHQNMDLPIGGTGEMNQATTTAPLVATSLQSGANTIVVGNTAGAFGYLDALRVSYTPAAG